LFIAATAPLSTLPKKLSLFPSDSERNPLNSAYGSVVLNTKRYTLTHHIATATTQITIRAIPRHGKSKNNDYSLLAQFGLTPKSRRGLAAGEVVDPLDAFWNRSRLRGEGQVTLTKPGIPATAATLGENTQRVVWSVIVVILSPRCNLLLRVVQQQKPVLIQTLSRQSDKA
jgi:hypothetical protein